MIAELTSSLRGKKVLGSKSRYYNLLCFDCNDPVDDRDDYFDHCKYNIAIIPWMRE